MEQNNSWFKVSLKDYTMFHYELQSNLGIPLDLLYYDPDKSGWGWRFQLY